MDAQLEYLRSFLEDELSDIPGVRVRVRQLASTERSIDLPQDYDPEANDLHTAQGVNVRAGSREYFFPKEWALGKARANIQAQVEEIRSHARLRD